MRVTSGEFGSRLLKVPTSARPTTDRARIAIFNMLDSAGGLAGLSVVDLFSGSGSLGIESLSRGAEFCTFVDSDREAVEVIKGNLKTLGITNARVVHSSAESFVSSMKPADIAFIDPPFAYSDEEWSNLLAKIRATQLMCESDRSLTHLLPENYAVLRDRSYGDSVVLIAKSQEGE